MRGSYKAAHQQPACPYVPHTPRSPVGPGSVHWYHLICQHGPLGKNPSCSSGWPILPSLASVMICTESEASPSTRSSVLTRHTQSQICTNSLCQIYKPDRHIWLRAGGEAVVKMVFCQITKVWILAANIDDDICCGKQTDRRAGSSVISAVCVCGSRVATVRLSPCHGTYVWDMEQLDLAEG